MKMDLKQNEGKIEALVLLIKNGDKDAFSDLYDIFIDPLYRYLYFSVPQSNVEDLTMVIFMKIWEKIASYKDQNGASFKSWFFKLARNVVVDFYRSNKEVQELPEYLEDDGEDGDPHHKVEQLLDEEKLKYYLGRVKKSYRDFLTLKFLGDFSNKEIAQIMKKKEASLRVLQHRALNSMKELIEQEDYFDS